VRKDDIEKLCEKLYLIKTQNNERNKTKRISKFLSLILRHQPETIGLKLDEMAGQM
jgi:RNA:NAD 2'-phosphotransferase (TPT1/KptA family)